MQNHGFAFSRFKLCFSASRFLSLSCSFFRGRILLQIRIAERKKKEKDDRSCGCVRGGSFDARSGGFNFVTHLRRSRRSDWLISNNGVNKRDLRSIDAFRPLDRATRRVNRHENGSCIRSDVKDRRWKGGNWINRRRDRLSGMKSGNVCLARNNSQGKLQFADD